jgi:hypothetical protein
LWSVVLVLLVHRLDGAVALLGKVMMHVSSTQVHETIMISDLNACTYVPSSGSKLLGTSAPAAAEPLLLARDLL